MISTTEIGKLIAQPETAGAENSADLAELARKYPYSQIFSILLLHSMKVAHDVHFDDELKKHSFRISDRARLYELMRRSNESITEKTNLTPGVQKRKEDSDFIDEASLLTTDEYVPETEEQVSYPIEQEPSDTESTMETIQDPDPLEKEILYNTFTANYKLEALSEEEEKALEERKRESILSEIPQESTKPEEEIRIDSKLSFTEWLHTDSNYKPGDNADKQAIDAVVDSFSTFNPAKELFGEVQKPKTEFFSPAKKAKESLSENRLPVSETLARIYALQGNYPKAIEAYEQLSLKYPEKKIFFADLIRDLKKQINK